MMKMISLLHTCTMVEQQQSPAVPDFKGKYIKRRYQNLCAPCLLTEGETARIFKAEVIGHLPAYICCLTWCYNCLLCGFQTAFVKEAIDTRDFSVKWGAVLWVCPSPLPSVVTWDLWFFVCLGFLLVWFFKNAGGEKVLQYPVLY